MSTKDITYKQLTDKDRDNVATLLNLGMKQIDVAKMLEIGKTSVSNIYIALTYAREEKWDELRTMINKKLGATVEWALKHEGKELPPEPKEIPTFTLPLIAETPQKMDMAEIKRVVTDAIAENCKDAKIEQIDKDQMARVMYALARIDERLEGIETSLKEIQEDQNTNEDNMYKLVVDFRNSVVMEMRNRK